MRTKWLFRAVCSVFAVACAAWTVRGASAAPTDFTQTSLELNAGFIGLQGVLLNSMRDPNLGSADAMFFYQPFQSDEGFIPGTMTRRNAAVGALTQTQVALLDPETAQPSFWLPLWTFGDSMGLLQPQVNALQTYSFDSMPLSDYNAPYGQVLWPLNFNPASPPVQFDAGPGGPLENFQVPLTGGLVQHFYGSAPFPTINDSPGLILAGEISDGINPAVVATFGARTDSGSLAPIPIETFSGMTSDTFVSPVVVQLGDFDGDGNTDRVLLVQMSSTPSQQQLILSKGNGDGTFQAPVTKPLAVSSGAVALAAVDFDSDGRDELVISYVTTDTEADPQGPGALEAVSDPLGAFSVRTMALPSSDVFPLWVDAMDCDQDNARDDLVVTTTRLVEAAPGDFVPHASDVVCYLNGDDASRVTVYPEASLNLPPELGDLPYVSFVINSAVGTLGCGDGWAGTALFILISPRVNDNNLLRRVKFGLDGEPVSFIADSVIAQHSECITPPPPPPGPPPLFEGSGCSLGGMGTPVADFAWVLFLPFALRRFRRK